MTLPYRILERKRAGMRLSEEEIRSVARGATDGSWSEGQLAAFLMAAAIRGLDPGDAGVGRALAALPGRAAALRQAFHRRRRRQGLPRFGAAPGELRPARCHADRPRSRA